MERARSLYKNDIDFAALALQSRDFAKQLNYIIWVQDLLDSTAGTVKDSYDPDREVVGLDVGTGCCSIYPLLGCKTRTNWKFIATDIDEQNARTAKENVVLNELESRIQIVKTDPEGPLFPLDEFDHKTLDFTMCNPPFYTSQEEMLSSAETKSHVPFSACTGAAVEMIAPGGEVEFVTCMINESLHLRDRIQWYTSMLGKLSSVTTLVELLIKHNNYNYAVTEFVQGSKTKRWAVAWSWGNRRPAMSVARNIPGVPKHLLPFPADFSFTLPTETNIDTAISTMNAELKSIPWYWEWNKSISAGVGFASENVWSRQARRKMKLAAQAGTGHMDDIPQEVALGVRVQLKLHQGKEPEPKEVQVLIRWIQGTDSVLFESFCGMVKRKMEDVLVEELAA
ncbi:hypothetical protein PENSUB_8219 [Penicillium subrubescens]|uniref:Methyltransferase-like protein C27D7.08c n=1 Tax=Penicillium subrubescens TaxID=1316194 RepID=A0A1Q5TIG9_9EURO|nr:hypothetical protein PENSUB_8219 [Penicillium subrubescens]